MQATSVAQQQARHGVSPSVGFFPEDTASGRLVSHISLLNLDTLVAC